MLTRKRPPLLYKQNLMSIARLVYSLFRRVRSVLLLFITISLLFYYTFQNEIDILNSYALNDSLPSINNYEHNTEGSSKLDPPDLSSTGSDRIATEQGKWQRCSGFVRSSYIERKKQVLSLAVKGIGLTRLVRIYQFRLF